MDPEVKKNIDSMSLTDMLTLWRFAKIGHPLLSGLTGDYFSIVLFAKKAADPEAWTRASKAVGWDR